ncbi:hypothetical protein GCM10010446_29020 [Streptomyces enissocaesilis]|uniref:Uncharacterized protein n=1 Tax=Streptomyces enissocaesilis TaxID=332589 RepID=A0ABP6JR59_9ACTN
MTGANIDRPGSAEEQAAAIVFLASDAAAFVDGAVLPVDDGWAAVRRGPLAPSPVACPFRQHPYTKKCMCGALSAPWARQNPLCEAGRKSVTTVVDIAV